MNNFDIELVYNKIKRHYKLKNNSELANFLGVKPQAISNSLERNQINWNNIITKCEELSIDELLGRDLPVAHPATEPGAGIPLIPINAMAGAFTDSQVVLELECERYVVPVFKEAEFLITVKGSSMIPKYNSGDIVACKRMPLDTFFQWNKVYVLDTEQGPLIKRVKKGTTDETLTIFSDNPKYEPFELPRTKIYHIALVVGVIRLE
jgi:SOS-response transcriptional repressor LexA